VSWSRALKLVFAIVVAVVIGPARAAPITVFAAASMKNALDEIARAYETRTGDKITVSYAASSALAKQIEQGAPADIFISADLDWMDYLEGRKLISVPSRYNLVRNRLALIAPAGSAVKLTITPRFPLASALGKERLAMANPDSVPAGRYGKAALQALGVWNDVQAKIASTNDVRSALLLVARGETPFGVVYRTDAAVDPRVRIVDLFPEGTHPPIVYPAALVAETKNVAAGNFLRTLRDPPARAIFEKHGFL